MSDLAFHVSKASVIPSHVVAHVLRSRAVQNALGETGWTRFHITDADFAPWLWDDFVSFANDAVRDLPDDIYDKSGLRKRRYAVFMYVPTHGELVPVSRRFDKLHQPKAAYCQPSAYQPEEGDNVRRFDGLREDQLKSSVLKALIEADYKIAVESGVLPTAAIYFVGLHIIKLQPREHLLATVSPNAIHRDGEPLTFCHLLGRRNIRGGRNLVADLSCANLQPSDIDASKVLADFELIGIGDSYVVDDRRVAHYVEGVGRFDPLQDGHRTVALIDFCPARRVRSDDLDNMAPSALFDLQQ